MRILFGDLDKYIDKFKTCAQTRPMESHDFFRRANTKPLFYKQGILSFDNLFNYYLIWSAAQPTTSTYYLILETAKT